MNVSCSSTYVAPERSIKLPVFDSFQNIKVIIVHENLKMIHFIHDTISGPDQEPHLLLGGVFSDVNTIKKLR